MPEYLQIYLRDNAQISWQFNMYLEDADTMYYILICK